MNNLKMDNKKPEDLKLDNKKSEDLKLDNKKTEDLKMDNLKMNNIKKLSKKTKKIKSHKDVSKAVLLNSTMKNKIKFIFPLKKNIKMKDLMIFDISLYSITSPKEADIISRTIKKLSNIKDNNLTITDGTAHIGGDTLSFSYYFKKVNSIEMKKEIYDALVNNIKKVYKRNNVKFYLGDCTKIIPTLTQDVIFISPPWGGYSYKKYYKVDLFLGDINIFDLILDWYNKKLAKMFCAMVPYNFNFEPFKKEFQNIYIQKIKNWYVIYVKL